MVILLDGLLLMSSYQFIHVFPSRAHKSCSPLNHNAFGDVPFGIVYKNCASGFQWLQALPFSLAYLKAPISFIHNMKAFRSFSRLGSKEVSLNDSRVNSQTDPLLPSSPSPKSSKPLFPLRNQRRAQTSPEDIAANIAKRKRAKYPHVQPPPPLANELELMQFTGGGTIDKHAKRVMDDQAKAAAGSGRANMGIADVYRDEKGRIWWDQDEELEYRHLLDGVDKKRAEKQVEEINWENFDIRQQPKENSVMVGPLFDRRNSASSSVESDHDPKFLLEADESPTFTSGSLNDRILVSSRFGGANMSSLSLPSRTMRVREM